MATIVSKVLPKARNGGKASEKGIQRSRAGSPHKHRAQARASKPNRQRGSP